MRLQNAKSYFAIFILHISTTSLVAQDPSLLFSGYIKSLTSFIIPGTSDTISASNLLHNRFNFSWAINSSMSMRMELRNRIFTGDQLRLIPGFAKATAKDEGYFDLSWVLLDNRSIVIHSIIDRLQLQYVSERFDLRLGRQRINWGIHNFWNPNDIFNSYNFLDFDFEERPGSDALRLQFYVRDKTSIETAFKPGKDFHNNTLGILYKLHWKAYDVQALIAIHQDDYVLGAGWAGGLGQTGWKTEFSYFIPMQRSSGIKNQLVLATMFDRTFAGQWYASVGTLVQSEEGDLSQLLINQTNTQLGARNLFPSKISLLGTLSKSHSNLLTTNITLLYATQRNLFIVYPTVSWNASDLLQLDLTVQSYFAKLNITYGSLAHAIYLRVKANF